MKIAFLTPNYPPERGACASRIHYTASALQKKGHAVEVFTFLPHYPTGKILKEYRRKIYFSEIQEQIKIWRFPLFPTVSSKLIWRVIGMCSMAVSILGAFFRLRKFKPDIIFVQSPPLLLGFSGWILARKVKAKFVLNLSDLWPRALLDLGAVRSPFLFQILTKSEKFLYRQADLCVGQSEEILTHLQHTISSRKTVLYRTGTDCELFFQTPISNHQNERPFRLVYAGLLGIAQDVLELCKNLNFNNLNTELHIYGDGADRKKLEQYLENNPNKGIFLHLAVNQTEVPRILHQFDAVLVIQKAEVYGTFPSKIYEAMAVGRPILQSGGGESANIIQHSSAGFVSAPKDYKSLAKNILKIQNLTLSEQQKLGDNGRKTALTFFDRKIQLERLEKKLHEQISS